MEWYIAVIIFLSAATIGGLVFIVKMVSVVEELRIENKKLALEIAINSTARSGSSKWA